MVDTDSPIETAVKGSPPKGGGLLSAFNVFVSGMNAIGTAWIFVLMVLINADAFGRTLFAAPIDGVIEMIELSLVGIVFMQLCDATRRGRLTRSDGFYNFVSVRKPRIGRYMGVAFDSLGAIFMLIIILGSVPLLIDAYNNDYFVGNEGLFTAPVWPVKLIILIGCTVTMFQFMVFVGRHLSGGKLMSKRK